MPTKKRKAETLFEETRLAKKPKTETTAPYLFNVPLQNKNFTGREGLLTQIAQTLASSSRKDVHPVILNACHGLGGVGKTQLALEYAYRHLQNYTAIYWVTAETREQIEIAFYQLGTALKLEPQSSQDIISRVKQWWEAHPGYLVIFDNAEDYAQIEPYLPRVNGQVLITSRYIQWPDQSIAVDVFGPSEANAYIQKLLGVAALPEAEQLAQTLGYLPLALAQACAFIKQNHITLSQYLEWYATKRAQLLQTKLLPPGDKHLPVYVNWEMTLKVIHEKNNHDKGEKLLTFCAYLQYTSIPKQLLLNYLANQQLTDELEQIKLLADLINYSLLQQDKAPNCYTLHPVMQEVLKLAHDEMTKATQLQVVNQQLAKLYPYGKDKLEDLQLKRQLLPHLERVLKQLGQNNFKQEQDDLLWLLIRLADGYNSIGDAKQQKAYLEQVKIIQEKRYGSDHLEVVSTLASLGNACGALGDAKQKKAYLEQALAIHEKHYGPNDPEVASILADLGIAYRALGDVKQQKANLERALGIKEKHYGKDHPKVASTLASLGNACGALGNTEKKKDFLERALAIKEKHYGNDHPQVAVTLANLGIAYGSLGDTKKQMAYLKRALDIKKNYYASDHPEVARTLASLGNAYGDLGDAKQQKVYLEQALAIHEKHYGPDHPDVASILFNLGHAYFKLHNIEQAVSLIKQSHAIFQKHYGDSHQDTQQAKCWLERYQNEVTSHTPKLQ